MTVDAVQKSYAKTMALCGFVALAAVAIALVLFGQRQGPVAIGVLVLLAAVGLMAVLAVASGVVVFVRDNIATQGGVDPFLACNTSRAEAALAPDSAFQAGMLRRSLAAIVLGHTILPGDEVEVCSFPEIANTLDENGMCDGLSFQIEMLRFCGQRATVFRSVDKIYDYGRTREMRRLHNGVLLIGLRCDGAAHGRCDALCYLIWHVSWLRQGNVRFRGKDAIRVIPRDENWLQANGMAAQGRYSCQYTELHSASRPFGRWSPLKDLRPLIAGNVTLPSFGVAQATRYFNWLQGMRGGQGFPRRPQRDQRPVPVATRLEVGDLVRVRSPGEISATLNERSKHAGLWFDRDMLKYCGTQHRVKHRIEQIIDDSNGRMIQMKTACVVLEGVHYSGEYLNLSAQHDYYFWREVWLERLSGPL